MLLDPVTLDLLPRAHEVLERTRGDPRFKGELPAAQLEIVTAPAGGVPAGGVPAGGVTAPAGGVTAGGVTAIAGGVPAAIAALGAARLDLAAAAGGIGRLAAVGVHPFTDPLGTLSRGARYDRTRREYGWIARAQLVSALQVHVAVGGAERSLAVHNALRAHLPELAALAAGAPLLAGRDTGLASVRPKLSELLPRQGVPPAIESWESLAEALRWGAAAGATPDAGRWWWELRPHLAHGTLELRVPDAQARLVDAAAVAAVVHTLTARLAARHDAGDLPAAVATWRIEENRWSACRDGVEGTMADLESGERRPTRERLHALLAELEPEARRLGCADELAAAHDLAEVNGAMRQRAVAADGGPRAVATWLAAAYLEPR